MSRPSTSILLVAVAGLGLGGCARPAPEPKETQGAATAAAPTLETRTRGWQVGQWTAYDLQLSTSVSLGGAADAVGLDVAGVVEVAATEVTPETATLFVAMSGVKVRGHDPRAQATLDGVERELGETGCFFALGAGRVTAMWTPRGLSSTAANTYRAVASALQVVRATPPGATYTAEEYDTTGRYVAEYVPVGDGARWHKRKLRYLRILGTEHASTASPARVVPQVDASSIELRLSSEGRPDEVQEEDALTIAGAQEPVRSKTSLTLRALPPRASRGPAPDWASLVDGMRRTDASDPYGDPAPLERLDAARTRGVTFDQAIAGLERFARQRPVSAGGVNGATVDPAERDAAERAVNDEARLFIALAAIFREQPETIGPALKRVAAHSPAADRIIEALSSAATPQTEAALAKLAASRKATADERNQDLMALARTPRPTPAAVDALRAELRSEPYNEIALLGLGTFSRRFRDAGDGASATTIGELLVSKLRAAQTTTDRLTALRAITNSGFSPALAPVLDQLKDADEDIRAAAVRALQSMNDPAVDGLLAERMRTDPSSAIREAALRAAKVREPSDALLAAVESVATESNDPHVRYRAVELLASWVTRRQEARATLARVAESDAELRIRQRAQRAL